MGVVTAIEISRATMRNVRQNLVGAFGYNALGIPVAMGAALPVHRASALSPHRGCRDGVQLGDGRHQRQPTALLSAEEDRVMTADRWIVTLLGSRSLHSSSGSSGSSARPASAQPKRRGGYQEAMILVKGGYTPDTIIVRSGRPVRLNFRREETASCSDKVIFADFQKSADLPTGQTVAVELLAEGAGRIRICLPDGHVPRTPHR